MGYIQDDMAAMLEGKLRVMKVKGLNKVSRGGSELQIR